MSGVERVISLLAVSLLACSSSSASNHDSDGGAGSGCTSNADCAQRGAAQFCKKDGCDGSSRGVCTATPGTRQTGYCTSETSFVCGCDGRTYPSSCLAFAVETNVAATGPCPLTNGGPCATSADCTTDQYCHKDHCADAMGICEGKPDAAYCLSMETQTCAVNDAGAQVCTVSGDPMCGCDHRSYENGCAASAAGVNVDSGGRCPALPSGPCASQRDCGDATYDDLIYCAAAACGASAGSCTPIPSACPNLYVPVCGCDGKTYPNDCFLAQAKVAEGSCPDAGR